VIVLDTHLLVWADNDERRLGRKARALIDRLWKRGQVAVCAMSFWEVALLASRGAGDRRRAAPRLGPGPRAPRRAAVNSSVE
jgi:PIN domain nuclease of toxin-antitoxin system